MTPERQHELERSPVQMTVDECRELRDAVFETGLIRHEVVQGDVSWATVRHNWMRPDSRRWLLDHSKIRLPFTDDQ